MNGRCLCGAVTVTARELASEISACHCAMCTRWSGSVQMGIEAPEDGVTVAGPVKVYRSSPFAERAWCDVCGSALWLRNVEGPETGVYEFVPGLFEDAAGARLVRVVYADCAAGGIELAGPLTRVLKADYERAHDHSDVLSGRCMCGAVKVEAAPVRDGLSACHCDMCRRWSSSVFLAFEAEDGSVKVDGPAKVITTSDWAERAFCTECGAPIFYRITAPGPMQGQTQMAAGLFDDAAGGTLKMEVYVDRQPHGYAFKGDHKRMTEAELLAAMGITPGGEG